MAGLSVILYRNLPVGTEENNEEPRQNNKYPARDSNRKPENNCRALSFRQRAPAR
jgi:hypothetical protein